MAQMYFMPLDLFRMEYLSDYRYLYLYIQLVESLILHCWSAPLAEVQGHQDCTKQ